jgi:hypothetical protein
MNRHRLHEDSDVADLAAMVRELADEVATLRGWVLELSAQLAEASVIPMSKSAN